MCERNTSRRNTTILLAGLAVVISLLLVGWAFRVAIIGVTFRIAIRLLAGIAGVVILGMLIHSALRRLGGRR